jgi:hypothetical protein
VTAGVPKTAALGPLLALALAAGCAVDSVCYEDSDCPAGRRCVRATGQCMLGDCAANEDCQADFECVDRRCVPETPDGPVCPDKLECPEGMVPVGSLWCIDRFEASRPDASADEPGTDGNLALSRAGVLPWAVNPMTAAAFAEFQAACEAAGKTLCGKDEWQYACAAEEGRAFVYGDVYDREICNGVDTWCDDFCADHDIEPCVDTKNCGYTLTYSFPDRAPPALKLTPTGAMPGCTNEFGHFDIAGNLWEVVLADDDPRGFEVHGGAFDCANADERHRCSFNAGWDELWAGFRCCWRPECAR